MNLTRSFRLIGACSLLLLSACAGLHSVQLSDVDSTDGQLRPFDVKVSDTGFDIHQATRIAKAVAPKSGAVKGASDTVSGIWSLLTFGPKTGAVTFSDTYADGIGLRLREACPSHKFTGLTTVRESVKYPVISGEIVRIKGYCVFDKSDLKEGT